MGSSEYLFVEAINEVKGLARQLANMKVQQQKTQTNASHFGTAHVVIVNVAKNVLGKNQLRRR